MVNDPQMPTRTVCIGDWLDETAKCKNNNNEFYEVKLLHFYNFINFRDIFLRLIDISYIK